MGLDWKLRKQLIAKWNAENGLTVEGSDIKRDTAIAEATPRFELWKPTKITLVMLHPSIEEVNNARAPQVTKVDPVSRESVVYTLMKWVRKDNSEIYLVDPSTGAKMIALSDSTIHEILHACGEIGPQKHDEVVRQTWIGVRAIKPMLGVK